jgi:hypothetical protein
VYVLSYSVIVRHFFPEDWSQITDLRLRPEWKGERDSAEQEKWRVLRFIYSESLPSLLSAVIRENFLLSCYLIC